LIRNVLLVGYGSIGTRHGALLKDAGCRVAVVSANKTCPHERFDAIEDALADRDFFGVVVATPSARHIDDLKTLAEAGYRGHVLVEKPLFSKIDAVPPGLSSKINVAYNLRYHPLLERIKGLLSGCRLYSACAYVGQYLPQWRPDRDYRRTYSASKDAGGGVLRDLSHELDYLQWLTGPWESVSAWGGGVSSLEIDSEDVFGLVLKTERCPLIQVHMNYFDLCPGGRRELLINAEGISLHGDFNRGFLSINGGEPEIFKSERNHTYQAQMQDWLQGVDGTLCTYEQGLATVNLIAAAEQATWRRCWVDR